METLHFGVDLEEGKLVKNLRNQVKVEVVLSSPERRILDLNKLIADLNVTTSSDFAHQMIEKVEEVTFQIS